MDHYKYPIQWPWFIDVDLVTQTGRPEQTNKSQCQYVVLSKFLLSCGAHILLKVNFNFVF